MNDATPSYKLAFEERPGHLYACIRAETMTREIALAYLREVADKCAELNCERLLIERDVAAMMPVADLFFTTEDFLQMIGDVRVAFVNPHSSIADQMDFAVLIGNNRGAEFSVHSSIAAAEEWLGEA